MFDKALCFVLKLNRGGKYERRININACNFIVPSSVDGVWLYETP